MNILFLCHRIPFPLNKGEKIRADHMVTHLAKKHTIHRGVFVDDPADMRHTGILRHIIGGECRNLVALDRLLMAGPRGKMSRVPVGRPALPLARAAQ